MARPLFTAGGNQSKEKETQNTNGEGGEKERGERGQKERDHSELENEKRKVGQRLDSHI